LHRRSPTRSRYFPLVNSTTALARRERALRFGILDDLSGDSIFLGKTRIQVVQFGQDAAVEPVSDAADIDERRFADGLDHRSEYRGLFQIKLATKIATMARGPQVSQQPVTREANSRSTLRELAAGKAQVEAPPDENTGQQGTNGQQDVRGGIVDDAENGLIGEGG
jgi:hypothetical protein